LHTSASLDLFVISQSFKKKTLNSYFEQVIVTHFCATQMRDY